VRPATDEVVRFLAKVIHADHGCHEWRGTLDRGGYGKFTSRSGRTLRAHRFSFEKYVGEIPQTVFVFYIAAIIGSA
jgi:hypothetical protein